MIKLSEVFEWIYRAIVIYLLYSSWCILEGFVALVVKLYG